MKSPLNRGDHLYFFGDPARTRDLGQPSVLRDAPLEGPAQVQPPVLKITMCVLTGYENSFTLHDSSTAYQEQVLTRSDRR